MSAAGEKKYSYNGKDLTALILLKIEHVVRIISEQNNLPFDECYPAFILSRTYRNLINTETLLCGESAEFIVDDYRREQQDIAAKTPSASRLR
jgi:hypothetical protein